MYHAFAERASAFATWRWTLTAAMLPPIGRELTHHRERGMEYLRDSRSFDAYQNHQKFQNVFHRPHTVTHTVPMARRTLLGGGTSAMIVALTGREQETNSRKTDKWNPVSL
jgi:hypothetical protein